ncbi:polysaccharide biosynthesis tyrosine autokinase [Edaphobacter sp. 12200R-103]|uniref:GumC family protein n=1 Tax=Edaphobacter sp. 12200R-103 TaxID=2703788 RepID=UPI00138B65A3|nr:polysaccharide biosynthesis tyrosine autokinase [Edaphobacter sp. 12200R-103]QHS51221.1 polysaccharide biosynthesis tyrosine autokinase [Edaphobacter sp. 12200R-103]
MGLQSAQTPPQAGGASDTSPLAFGTAATDTTLSETLVTLRKRKRVLLAFVLAGLLYGIYAAETQPRIYEAFGRIQVRSGSSNEYRVSSVSGASTDSSQRLLTEVAILQSDSLMLTVAREMDLANNPDFLNGPAPKPRASLDDPAVRQATIHGLLANLVISQVQKTEIIRISYRSLSPKLAADIVNKIISAYIQRSYETRFASSQRVSNWLSGQLDDLKQQVQSSQERMLDVQKRLGILGFDPNHSQITSSLEQLSTASNQARIARIMAESQYRMLSTMDPNSIEGAVSTGQGIAPSQINTLRAQLATARASLAQIESDLGPNHPTVKAQKAQIDELSKEISTEQQRLVLQAKQTYLAALKDEQDTTAALEAEKNQAYKMRDDLVEYTIRQREFESDRNLYEGLLQRLRTAGVEAGLESLEIDVVDPALLPANPTLKRKTTVVLTYLVLGFIAGVMMAFLLESLDTGLQSVADVEAFLELPSLAIIPRFKRSAEAAGQGGTAIRNITSLSQPKSQFAESFRSLRTALLLSSAGHPPRTILLTSATPSEGKTTASVNLATVLAQGNARVLLIDADLRRPTVHEQFGLSARVGLSSVLTGSTPLEQAVQQISSVPNLDVLVSGPMPPFPTELLSSEMMRQLLQSAKESYTHVVIDSPPVLSVTDAVILSREADAVVLVIRQGKSSKPVVRRARDLLVRSGAPLSGILLNAVDISSPDYYGYYGYSGYTSAGADSESWKAKSDASSGDQSGEVK